jgi:glutamate-1-semialdehyde-2,1-aminomutase
MKSDRFAESTRWLERAKRVIPTASQTYSKSYRYYCEGAAPAFIDRAVGSHAWDLDGNEYIDYILALGPITVGYADPVVNQAITRQLEKGIVFSLSTTLEVELTEKLVEIIPCAEMIRFVKNGSDATTAAVRLARAFSGKDLILSCGYHGMQDWSIGGSENNLGVPKAVQALLKTFPYNDVPALTALLEQYRGQVAAIVMEPVRTTEPDPDYLQKVRQLANDFGVLLIFDEVVTGFRMALGGAQEYYKVTPDLAALGKGMANGMPLSAVVGRADIMKLIDEGAFVSLTFGGETLSLAAGLATISELEKRNAFEHFRMLGDKLYEACNDLIKRHGLEDMAYMSGTRSMPGLFFKPHGAATANDILSLFQQEAVRGGVLFLGVHYFCASHTLQDMERTIQTYDKAFGVLAQLKSGVPLEHLLHGKTYRPVFKRNKN